MAAVIPAMALGRLVVAWRRALRARPALVSTVEATREAWHRPTA